MSLTCAENSTSSFRSRTPSWCPSSSAPFSSRRSGVEDGRPGKHSALCINSIRDNLAGDQEKTKKPASGGRGPVSRTRDRTGAKRPSRRRLRECSSSWIPSPRPRGVDSSAEHSVLSRREFLKSGPAATGLLRSASPPGRFPTAPNPLPSPMLAPSHPEGAAPPRGANAPLAVARPRLAPASTSPTPPTVQSRPLPTQHSTPAHRYR
jgi:hypothetical protein